MIYVTGDTHGLIDYRKLHIFAGENPSLTHKDYMIVCGDFGGVWSKETLFYYTKMYQGLNFTTLFVDGNHENFDMLKTYKVEKWNGGKVQKIEDNVIHLLRGQVFNIEDKKIFTFGGATSIDKIYRTEGVSWWKEEIPSREEIDEGLENLEKNSNKVDYIITHSIDERALHYSPLTRNGKSFRCSIDNVILSTFEEKVEYKHWYFGHYHLDGDLNDKKTVIYEKIRELETNKVVFEY